MDRKRKYIIICAAAGTVLIALLAVPNLTKTDFFKEDRHVKVTEQSEPACEKYGTYIKQYRDDAKIDFSIVREQTFEQYEDYLQGEFITEEKVDERNFGGYMQVIVGDSADTSEGHNFAGLLVKKDSMKPVGYQLNK